MRKIVSLKTWFYSCTICALLLLAIIANYNYYVRHKVNAPMVFPGSEENDYVAVFSYIYEHGHWGGGSGPGSDPSNAVQYISLLQKYFDDPRFVSIVDLGCGDWQIMSRINIPKNKRYQGFDVVPSLIAANTSAFSQQNVHFNHINSLKDFAASKISGDLLIIKDVMQHWPNSEIEYFIANILPNFKYALITNYQYAAQEQPHNNDYSMGPWHSVSLLSPPFNLQNTKVVLEYDGPDHKQVLFYVNPA